ncbi:hypothetical protein Spla01_00437 [Streptomyces platensis]|uniref:Enamine/imine deaminase n=1 Tax=Streptomyces platensis TaxID=58346 RepID=A0ABX3Y3A1_STRPT|nr:Enamine/imine deaminase [Streptomyces platensis]
MDTSRPTNAGTGPESGTGSDAETGTAAGTGRAGSGTAGSEDGVDGDAGAAADAGRGVGAGTAAGAGTHVDASTDADAGAGAHTSTYADASPAVGAGRLERVNPPHLAPPTGFSHGVRAASGTMVFLAGQTALDGAGRIVGEGIVEQFERALGNLLEVAAASGAGPGDLAKLTVFAVDVADYRLHAREIGRVWKRLVGGEYPAMAVIGATRLWDEAALVEIEGIAVVR